MFHRKPDFGKSDCDIIHRNFSAMGRYRPREPAGSKYITPQGARRLREELGRALARGAPAGDAGGERRGARRAIARRTPTTPTASAACARSTAACASCASASRAWWSSSSRRRPAARVLRRLGRARGRGRHARAPPHRRAGRVRHGARLHQHGFAARAGAAEPTARRRSDRRGPRGRPRVRHRRDRVRGEPLAQRLTRSRARS